MHKLHMKYLMNSRDTKPYSISKMEQGLRICENKEVSGKVDFMLGIEALTLF